MLGDSVVFFLLFAHLSDNVLCSGGYGLLGCSAIQILESAQFSIKLMGPTL